jgi:hypothetical protein
LGDRHRRRSRRQDRACPPREQRLRHGRRLCADDRQDRCRHHDGAYGAEIHRLRPKKVDDAHTVFGRPDFATIAGAVGIEAVRVNDLGQFDKLFAAYQKSDRAMLWDIQIDDRIPSRTFRRLYYGEN